MGSADAAKRNLKDVRRIKAFYEAPEIIYKGKISIRAGTPESSVPGVPGVPSSDSIPFEDTTK